MFVMRIFIAVLILIFSLQTPSQADDIRDFQIEGISIGDSLLDYFGESKIKKNIKNSYYRWVKKDNRKYATTQLKSCKFWGADTENCVKIENYNGLQATFKRDDKKYIVYGLSGIIDYRNNIEDCYEKKDEIFKEIKGMFKNLKISHKTKPHPRDANSKTVSSYYWFPTKDFIRVTCMDWSKETGLQDNLRIGILSSDFNNWMKGK